MALYARIQLDESATQIATPFVQGREQNCAMTLRSMIGRSGQVVYVELADRARVGDHPPARYGYTPVVFDDSGEPQPLPASFIEHLRKQFTGQMGPELSQHGQGRFPTRIIGLQIDEHSILLRASTKP